MCYNRNVSVNLNCADDIGMLRYTNIRRLRQKGALIMKKFLRTVFLIVIIFSALISVRYAIDLYRTKYVPRYLKGNAC